MPEPQRHADHGAGVTCRPAGNGLCEPVTALRGEEWRKAARAAIAGLHAQQRRGKGRRRAPEVTGVVVPPPELPLDGER